MRGGSLAAGAGLLLEPVRLVDATSVAKASRARRETGGRRRFHSVFDLANERFTAFELTDESEGEVVDRAGVITEPLIADHLGDSPHQAAA
jgi:hypothetical protein